MNPRNFGRLYFALMVLFPSIAIAQTALSVQTGNPRPETLRNHIEVPGSLLARESITLRSPVNERVAAVHFSEGQMVDTGDLLVELDRATENAQLKLARAQLKDAQLALARSLKLSGSKAVSEADLDTARVQVDIAEASVETAQAALQEREIRAPFTGRIGLTDVEAGSYLSAGEAITTLHDISHLRVEFDLPQSRLGLLANVLTLRFRLPEGQNAAWRPAELISSASSLNTSTRALRLRAETANSPALRPGMAVIVEAAGPPHSGLTIPEVSLIPRGGEQYVYRITDGKAERVKVTTGIRREGRVEIIRGLTAEDSVVVRGGDRLRPGTPVQASPAK